MVKQKEVFNVGGHRRKEKEKESKEKETKGKKKPGKKPGLLGKLLPQ